jgi:glycosyltransferase involved in cell wall biosynthesis
MEVVVAHEWLTNWAGSEHVAKELVRIGEASRLVTSISNPTVAQEHLPGLDVQTLWTSALPGAHTHWARYAVAMLAAWATVKIRADALLISSHFAAHAAALRFDGPSIVYYHTPGRIIWRPDLEFDRIPRLARGAAGKFSPLVQAWDRRIAQKPSALIANSKSVAMRVRIAYGRDATVIPPPVDVGRGLAIPRGVGQHFLWVGRLVTYKRPDVAVEAARLSGFPLIVIGDGPLRAKLELNSPANVRFLGRASDHEVREAMAAAVALVFPGEEDFGITPVEALAAGVPVVAYAAGGALDYITNHENGLLVPTQDPRDFASAMRDASARQWETGRIRQSALQFDRPAFEARIEGVLDRVLGESWKTRGASARIGGRA